MTGLNVRLHIRFGSSHGELEHPSEHGRQPAAATEGRCQGRVLLIIYTHPEWHPTLVHTAQTVSDDGIGVDILCLDTPQRAFLGPVDFGERTSLHLLSAVPRGWRGKAQYVRFVLEARRLVRRTRPACVIGYDMFGLVAAFLATVRTDGAALIYHNFDLAVSGSPIMRSLIAAEGLAARRACMVLASSSGRAAMLRERARLTREPRVFMNCQRLHGPAERTGELRHMLGERGRTCGRVVLRLGTLGPGHGIEATIRSIPLWNGKDWTLVLGGSCSDAYLAKVRGLVEQMDLQDRVLFLPSLSRTLWYDCLYSADLGVALYEPGNINHASMAGAGNKLNLYLKAGIPCVVPALPDFESFLQSFPVGVAVDPGDPTSIAGAVNRLLGDGERYQACCRQARSAFATELNFERQVEPLLRQIQEACAAPRPGMPEVGR